MLQGIKLTAILLTVSGVVALGVGVLPAASAEPQTGPFYSDWSTPVPVPELKTIAADYPNCISRDGLSLYFHRVNSDTGEDLYVVHRPDTETNWGSPIKLPTGINTNANERTAFISTDGHWLYFASDRPGGKGASDLYASWRANTHDDDAWQPPVNLTEVNSAGFDSGPFLYEDAGSGETQLYFSSSPFPGGTQARADIYVSVLGPNGFSSPLPVIELNSPGGDSRPYLRHDGREMFIQTNRSGTTSIYVSTRPSTDKPWSTPVVAFAPANFGDPSVSLVVTPVLSWDAKTLFIGVWKNGIDIGDVYISHREMVSAANACFRSPQYYLLNLQQVSARIGMAPVVIGGVNYNQPISVADNLWLVRAVLQGNSFPGLPPSTPMDRLNQEFLAAQLSVALSGSPGSPAAYGVLNGQLQCYGSMLTFRPVTLSNGIKLTRYSTMGELFEQARLAICENRIEDMDTLANLFDLLNGNDPSGTCRQ